MCTAEDWWVRDTCYSLASCEEVEEECDITACSSGHKVITSAITFTIPLSYY